MFDIEESGKKTRPFLLRLMDTRKNNNKNNRSKEHSYQSKSTKLPRKRRKYSEETSTEQANVEELEEEKFEKDQNNEKVEVPIFPPPSVLLPSFATIDPNVSFFPHPFSK